MRTARYNGPYYVVATERHIHLVVELMCVSTHVGTLLQIGTIGCIEIYEESMLVIRLET